MSKVKSCEISPKEKRKIIENFFEVVLKMKTKKEIIDFFMGLLASSETLMFARRIQIAQMIVGGKTYEDIRSKMKVGYDTITKTEKWLHGNDDKYNKWITGKLQSSDNDKIKNKTISSNKNYGSLLDKYAHHRFLKDLFE